MEPVTVTGRDMGMAANAMVHIVDDDAGVRESLGFLLETAGLTVRGYASAAAFLEVIAPDQTGCLMTDVRMPGMDGLALQQCLAERGSTLSVIVMTAHGDVPMAVRALKGGAVDFLEKPFDNNELLQAVHHALATSTKAAEDAVAIRAATARLGRLTAREKDVLHGLVAGRGNKEIGNDLGVSPRTVEVHRARVMEKMSAGSLPDLIRLAQSAGVMPPAQSDPREIRQGT